MNSTIKILLLICGLITIVCYYSDGRMTRKEALKQAVSEFNHKNGVEKTSIYHPENYVEIVTDTLIADVFKVHIKNYSLMEENLLITNASDANSNKKTYQRIFASEIQISKTTKDIFKMDISAREFKVLFPDSFWEHATLQHAWVNQELSNEEAVKLDISFLNPQNNNYKLYRMSIDHNGQHSLNLIEQRS